MKINKKCPKCQSEDILFIPGNIGTFGTGNNIPIGISTLSSVLVERYVCCECGFSEEWIDVSDVKKLEKKYRE